MSFEKSYSIESHERIKLILIFADKSLLLKWWVTYVLFSIISKFIRRIRYADIFLLFLLTYQGNEAMTVLRHRKCYTNLRFQYLVPELLITDRQYEERSVSRRDSSYQGWDKSKIYCWSYLCFFKHRLDRDLCYSSLWLFYITFYCFFGISYPITISSCFHDLVHDILVFMNFACYCYL